MKGDPSQKPVAAETAHGLQVIERFGQLLGINNSSELHAWQTSPRYTIYVEPTGKGRYLVRYQDQIEDVLLIARQSSLPWCFRSRVFLISVQLLCADGRRHTVLQSLKIGFLKRRNHAIRSCSDKPRCTRTAASYLLARLFCSDLEIFVSL